jgi:hypothetical protein
MASAVRRGILHRTLRAAASALRKMTVELRHAGGSSVSFEEPSKGQFC